MPPQPRSHSEGETVQKNYGERQALGCIMSTTEQSGRAAVLLREPLNKSHMSRVSGAMASDARRRGAANSAYYSQAAQQSR